MFTTIFVHTDRLEDVVHVSWRSSEQSLPGGAKIVGVYGWLDADSEDKEWKALVEKLQDTLNIFNVQISANEAESIVGIIWSNIRRQNYSWHPTNARETEFRPGLLVDGWR